MAEPNNTPIPTPIPASTPRSGSPSSFHRNTLPNTGHSFSLSASHFSPVSPSRFTFDQQPRLQNPHQGPTSIPVPPFPSNWTSSPPSSSRPSTATSAAAITPGHPKILILGLDEEREIATSHSSATTREIVRVNGHVTGDEVLKCLRNKIWGDQLTAVWDFISQKSPHVSGDNNNNGGGGSGSGFIWDEDLIEALPKSVKSFWIVRGGDEEASSRVDRSALQEYGIEFHEIQSTDGVEEIEVLMSRVAW